MYGSIITQLVHFRNPIAVFHEFLRFGYYDFHGEMLALTTPIYFDGR
jgi:hypothetical protein